MSDTKNPEIPQSAEDLAAGNWGATDENSEVVESSESVVVEDLSTIEAQERDKIAQLEQKVGELKDLYVRAQAEMQNVIKRNVEDVKKARDYSVNAFAKEIITIKDYLEMALLDQSNNFDNLKMGVDLTLKQLIQVFEHQGIKSIEPKAEDKFDPNLHQAIETVEVEGQPSGTIVEVKQKGYKLIERVLRPARVTVAK